MELGDVHAIVCLLGEFLGGEQSLARRKHRLLSRLCGLVGADQWGWSLLRRGSFLPLAEMAGAALRPHLALAPDRPAPGVLTGTRAGPADMARPTITVRQISGEGVSTIHLLLRRGCRPFSAQERRVAQIVLTEIPWLHEAAGVREVSRVDLPPRHRATLLCVAGGLGRAEIARRLRLSPHTVHGYLKDIYRHYGVHSLAELTRLLAITIASGPEVPA